MIRIETIAEFDAEGRFTVSGQATIGVSPGPHRVTVEVEESDSSQQADVSEPPLQKIGNVFVLTGSYDGDPESVRRQLDQETAEQLLRGPFE